MFDALFLRPALIAAGVASATCLPLLLRGSTPRTRAWVRLGAVTLGAYATFVVVQGDGWWPKVTSRVDHGIWAVVFGAVLGALQLWRGRSIQWVTPLAAILMARLLWLERWAHERRLAFIGILLLVLLSTYEGKPPSDEARSKRRLGLWIALAGCTAAAPFSMALSFGQIALGVLAASLTAHAVLRREWAQRPLPDGPILALVVGTLLLSLHAYASLPVSALLLLAAAPSAEGAVEYLVRERRAAFWSWIPAAAALALTVAGVLVVRAANPHWNPYA